MTLIWLVSLSFPFPLGFPRLKNLNDCSIPERRTAIKVREEGKWWRPFHDNIERRKGEENTTGRAMKGVTIISFFEHNVTMSRNTFCNTTFLFFDTLSSFAFSMLLLHLSFARLSQLVQLRPSQFRDCVSRSSCVISRDWSLQSKMPSLTYVEITIRSLLVHVSEKFELIW